ncbi:GNAT family N-acetyltransferase [Paenibacillus glycanilyticus]|uniref:Ribosomal-protein-alanine acetyltransferase n=1 Tax=Paenibacillus glycanilyticus TaxID=126569 RepID=A0ABQ6GAB4_9BACL|nr:putative ribosomal-protein-alanine acetyltransferase [Paenibacillus glycanilyticus]
MSDSPIYLRQLELTDAPALLELRIRNRSFYQPYEPLREERHFTLEEQEKDIAAVIHTAQLDQAYAYGIFIAGTDELVGRIALTSISRGVFQNGYLGYSIDQAHNGRGYATAAVSEIARKAFVQLGLHRVQAGVMPRNKRSVRVLEKAGFRPEGLAERYLKINGTWEDHLLFAMTSEDYN